MEMWKNIHKPGLSKTMKSRMIEYYHGRLIGIGNIMNGIVVVIMLTLRISAWLFIMTARLVIWLIRKVFYLFKKLGNLLIGLARKWKQKKKSQQ